MMDQAELTYRQGLSLDEKVLMTRQRIRDYVEWAESVGKTPMVAFSGGIDSTVLLHIARHDFPSMRAVFSNTGLEFPEIVSFVHTFEGVDMVRPKVPFHQVVKKFGWPVTTKKVARMIRMLQNPTEKNAATRNLYLTGVNQEGKFIPSWKLPAKWLKFVNSEFKVSDKCCDCLKKEPMGRIKREFNAAPITGTMVEDSAFRRTSYMTYGCSIMNEDDPVSRPMSFWGKDDIWAFVRANQISYCSVYDMGYQRTGCTFCGFGAHLDRGMNRFQLLERTHPQLHKYVMDTLGMERVLRFTGVRTRLGM